MSSSERVLSALNFLTGKGVNYYPDGCNRSAMEALITDYFNEGPSDDESDDESDHRNEGKNVKPTLNTMLHHELISGQQELTECYDQVSEGTCIQ